MYVCRGNILSNFAVTDLHCVFTLTVLVHCCWCFFKSRFPIYFVAHFEHIYFCPYVVIVHGWIIRFHCQIQCHSIYILWNKYIRVVRICSFCWTFWSICHTKRILRHERILCVFSNQSFWRRSWNKRCIGTPSWKWLEMPRTRVFINPPGQWLSILKNITICGSQNYRQCFSMAVISGSPFSV